MMRKLLALLLCLSLLVLCGCTSSGYDRDEDDRHSSNHRNDREDEDTDDEDPDNAWNDDGNDPFPGGEDPKDPQPEPQVDTVIYTYVPDYDNGWEYCILEAFNADGDVVWTHTSNTYEFGQLSYVAWVGENSRMVCYCEGGTVVALDRESGEVIWENSEFGGMPTSLKNSCLVTEDGTVYLTGYFGPDFMVLDSRGNTVYRTDSVHPDYYWPYGLELGEDSITIILEGGPQGSDRYTVTLDLNTWEVID